MWSKNGTNIEPKTGLLPSARIVVYPISMVAEKDDRLDVCIVRGALSNYHLQRVPQLSISE